MLRSWKRAAYIGGLLVGLYAVLYILLSLEAFSLLIGSLLLLNLFRDRLNLPSANGEKIGTK